MSRQHQCRERAQRVRPSGQRAHRERDTALASCDASVVRAGWGSFEPVPTVGRVLIEGKDAGWRLLLELKNIPGEPNFDPTGQQAASALLALVAQTAFPVERLVVQSFFPTSLDAIELGDPRIATALLTTSQISPGPPGAGFYATQNGAYATARGYEITAPDQRSPDLSPETVAAIQATGRAVVLWTVNAPTDIERAIALGVDGIISDRPDLVVKALAA
jgi:glycerophosphoryl diester phosphodiesterase